MITSSTMGKLPQDLTPLLKGVIDTFFTSCLGLIRVVIVLTILLLDFLTAILFGSATLVGKSGEENYARWQKRIESLSYVFENDCNTLLDFIEEKGIKFDDLFKVKSGQHPPLVKLYLANKITVETMVILNDILNYSKQFNKEIGETVIWPKKHKLLMNYKPFLKYNITKMKMIIKKKINER